LRFIRATRYVLYWTDEDILSSFHLRDHPLHGGLDLRIGERGVAALGRHVVAVRTGVAIDRVLHERRDAFLDARRPRGLVGDLGRACGAGRMTRGAQVVEDRLAVGRSAVSYLRRRSLVRGGLGGLHRGTSGITRIHRRNRRDAFARTLHFPLVAFLRQ